MKTLILALAAGLSIVAAGSLSASAESFAIHGYQGTHYGR